MRLHSTGQVLMPFIMRLIMAWEFYESGLEKYKGENWFANIQAEFPFPFNIIPPDISWNMATVFELMGSVFLALGLFTRFTAYSLLILTFVATAAVHWPDMISMWSDLAKGYAITDMGYGNFKLPLLFAVLLLPIIFQGPGKLSLDHLIARSLKVDSVPTSRTDGYAWGITLLLLGLPFLMLIPFLGIALCFMGGITLGFSWVRRN